MSDVVVIGGGIVGSSVAYRLARAKAKVTLVDRADIGRATAAGAGIISPGTSFRPPPAFYPLAAKANEFYPQLVHQLAEDGETESGYETVGALFVAVDDEELSRLPALVDMAERRRATGVQGIGEITTVTTKEAQTLFPALSTVRGGYHVAGSSRVDGRLMCQALQSAAVKRGATVLRGTAMPVRDGERITHVEVEGTTLATDYVVIAGGAWSNEIGDAISVNLPVYPQRGQILHLLMPDVETSRWPVVVGFHTHYILAFPANRIVAGATREDQAGYDYRTTAGGVHEALGAALRIAPGLSRATLHEIRVGFRPASPDRLPILGQVQGIRNLFLATGHGASGLQLGPYSGAAVADLVLGKPVALDFAPYQIDRFETRNTLRQGDN